MDWVTVKVNAEKCHCSLCPVLWQIWNLFRFLHEFGNLDLNIETFFINNVWCIVLHCAVYSLAAQYVTQCRQYNYKCLKCLVFSFSHHHHQWNVDLVTQQFREVSTRNIKAKIIWIRKIFHLMPSTGPTASWYIGLYSLRPDFNDNNFINYGRVLVQ